MSLFIYAVVEDGSIELDLCSSHSDALHYIRHAIQERYTELDLTPAGTEDQLRELLLDEDVPIDFQIQEIETPDVAIKSLHEALISDDGDEVDFNHLREVLEFLQ